jgi:UDPglucose 6-dehydrogenase
MERIGEALGRKNSYHLVVISSTVMPGDTGGRILPLLESVSRKRCGRDFGLCYNPQFIALGSVIENMSNPDMILVGESDSHAGSLLADIALGLCRNNPPVMRMNFMNAELVKLSVNTYVTTKISYANMLAELCEKLPDADVDVVTSALGMDTRIGSKYLKGGLGYGGPCFPRDNVAFAALARRHGVQVTLAEATHEVNLRQARRLSELLMSLLPEGGTIGILGLAYKPLTYVVEESQGLAVAQKLAAGGASVVVYDPLACKTAERYLDGRVVFAETARQCAALSHVVAITTPWEEFGQLRPEDLNFSLGRPSVVDCWRQQIRHLIHAESNKPLKEQTAFRRE